MKTTFNAETAETAEKRFSDSTPSAPGKTVDFLGGLGEFGG